MLILFFVFVLCFRLRGQLVHVYLNNIQCFVKIPVRHNSAQICVPMLQSTVHNRIRGKTDDSRICSSTVSQIDEATKNLQWEGLCRCVCRGETATFGVELTSIFKSLRFILLKKNQHNQQSFGEAKAHLTRKGTSIFLLVGKKQKKNIQQWNTGRRTKCHN